ELALQKTRGAFPVRDGASQLSQSRLLEIPPRAPVRQLQGASRRRKPLAAQRGGVAGFTDRRPLAARGHRREWRTVAPTKKMRRRLGEGPQRAERAASRPSDHVAA